MSIEEPNEITRQKDNASDIQLEESPDLDITHEIEYDHYMDATPVGVFLSAASGLLFQAGGAGAIIFCGVFMLMLIMYMHFMITIFFSLVTFVGVTLIASYMVTRNTPVRADSAGLSLPFVFSLSTNFQLDRHWTELKAIGVLREDFSTESPDKLCLAFHDGCRVDLNLGGFSKASLKKLILLINTYRPDLDVSSSVRELRLGIEQSSFDPYNGSIVDEDGMASGGDALSFTEMWKKELSARYGSTAFVPLACGEELQEGRIKVIGQVAFGGMSAVYLAEREGSSMVILKESILPESADRATREKAMELFQREARILCTIDHPYIAAVYDYFVENDRHYMMLEYVEGTNLRAYIQEHGAQNEETILRWGEELATILDFLHSLSPPIIHRDLTPENVMIGRDGKLTVIDFGAANTFLGTATGTVVGKSAYIPLEQFQGRARPVSDIYSLGATMYFLATEKDPEPFTRSSTMEGQALISGKLNDLIGRCTEVNPGERIQSASQVASELRIIRGGAHREEQ